eukprot:scaffold305250_cov77-Attheya_sp.AAC.3
MAPNQIALSSSTTTMSVPAAEANLQQSHQHAATPFFCLSDSPPYHHRFTTDSPRPYHCPYLTRNATANAPAEANLSSTLHEK